ncbi:hypothetical protein MHU86_4698 [Fragilaria crotonensis]|nr:hypothetical protein MHU86_4698 [Fragilaria crotonensis]
MFRQVRALLSWVLPFAFLVILVDIRNFDSMVPQYMPFQLIIGKKNAGLSVDGSLTYLYQTHLDKIGWLNQQCSLCRAIIHANQTAFPYLQVPPILEEYQEQFNPPLRDKTRIAMLHVWSSSQMLAPPFFQYWVASALANDLIADFLIFVPDNATAALLRRLMPDDSSLLSTTGSNIRLHVVGDLAAFYRNRLGPTLVETMKFKESGKKFVIKGTTLSRLKPMLGYVFQDYIQDYSHWAWADQDLILGNLTKFLARPIAEGYPVISMSAVERSNDDAWSMHICTNATALAGQLTVFANTDATRNYFRHGDLSQLQHMYDEKNFPAMLQQMGIRIAHVFVQVTDQWGFLDGSRFHWSPRGLFKVGADGGCFEYEAGLVHVMQGKLLVRPPVKKLRPTRSRTHIAVSGKIRGRALRINAHSGSGFVVVPPHVSEVRDNSLENTIFPGPFVWESLSGFMLNFPVASSAPWQPYYGDANHTSDILRMCDERTQG